MTGCQTTIRQTRLASSLACVLAVAITPPASAAAPRAGGSVVVHGSWAGLKIAGRLAMEFNRRNPKAAVDFLPRDSNQMGGILRERECDVGLVLDSLAPNVGETLGQRFDAFPLGRFSVGVIVNARNRARSIEADALGSAFQGNVTSWADVGKGNGPRQIELFMPLAPTSESWIFQHGVMQGGFSAAVCNESTRFHRQKLSDAAIVGAVIEKQNAIAFFLLGPNTIIDDRIRLLAIAKRPAPAVLPTLETIAEGTYPIIDQLTFFLHPDAPPAAREFVAFATGPEGAAIVREYGLWPERELEQHRGEVRLKDVKAGKGAPVAARGIPGAADAMAAAAADFVRAKTTIQLRYQSADPGSSEKEGPFREGAGLFVSDRPLPQSESSNVESAQLADRAVAVVVHPANAIDRLTVSELRDVFAGKVITWPEETRRIELYGLSRNHELAEWFEQKIVGPTREARVRRRASTTEVIEAVAASPVGIGFVDVAEIGPDEDRVKVVGLVPPDGAHPLVPSRERVPRGYPLAQPLLLYLSPEADGTTWEFFDFLAAGGGSEAVRKHGFVPSPPCARTGTSVPATSDSAIDNRNTQGRGQK